MKNKSFLLLSSIILLVSCNKFGDTNIDPTQSVSIDPAYQLAFAQKKFGGDLNVQERLTASLTMPMVQHIGGGWINQYGQFYVKQERFTSSVWEENYSSDLKNLVDAEIRTRNKAEHKNINGMLRVMKVYLFARLTDLFGDIPYTDASKGALAGISYPKYDKQEDIYTDFFRQLDTSFQYFNEGKDVVKNDAFYKGDIQKWKKFTSSLRLRLALRIAKRNKAKAIQEVQKAYVQGLMESVEDNCITLYENVQNDYVDYRGNGISAALSQGDAIYHRVSNSLINQLKQTDDPRLYVLVRNYLDKASKPQERIDITQEVKEQVGTFGVGAADFIWDDWKMPIEIEHPVAGKVQVSNNLQKAQVANPFIANNAPFFHLTYAETELLLADAAIRLNLQLGVSAEEHYKRGVRAAMQQLAYFPKVVPVKESDIENFLEQNKLEYGKELEQINTQLWIVYFLNGPEAFANLRRSGFPHLPSGYKQAYSSSATMPRRFEYPISEKTLNKENVSKAIERMGGKDSWNARVWWDVE